jgi:exodeoxyribonuclease VII large subunit
MTHALRHAARSGLSRKTRRYQDLRLNLEQFDLRRRLGTIRARLIRVDGALRTAASERNHLAGSQLQNCAARLESLSPLGVLGRGYAVCWNADRTKVVRKASEVNAGDRVRVTLAEGELRCDVASTSDSTRD